MAEQVARVYLEVVPYDECVEYLSTEVVGTAREVKPEEWPATAASATRLGLKSWAAGSKDRWIRLVPPHGYRSALDPRLASRNARRIRREPYWRLSASS